MRYLKIDYKKFIEQMEFYDCIIIDPPWNFNDKPKAISNQLSYKLWDDNVKCLNYLFNHLRCNYIFLWTCNSLLHEVFKSQENSDFIYKTQVTWCKLTNKNNIFYGLGNTFRNSTEQMLIFQKPKLTPLRLSLRNIIHEPCSVRTCKPKIFESNLIKILNMKNMNVGYIFSGPYLTLFKDLNVDCVDCINYNNECEEIITDI